MIGQEKNLYFRSEGVTNSEKYLANLCEKGFLRLWSYPGIYRDQYTSENKKTGKEVCDLLVVFDQHLIIFSDKDCVFPDTGNLDLDWSRWVRRAIIKSADQLFGAERWIKNYPERLFLDSSCTQKIPIPLPNMSNAKFHRVLVAHGVSARCKKEFTGGSGSLLINTDICGDMHLRNRKEGGQPLIIGQIDPQRGYVHVLDDYTVGVLLSELDTISDFVNYLEKKEKLITSDIKLLCAGEEDLLAIYHKNINDKGEHDFIFDDEFNLIAIEEGFWEDFRNSPEYISRKEANIISYTWDSLIELFSFHALQGTQYIPNPYGIPGTEIALRFLARETRTRRRFLSRSLLEVIGKSTNTENLVRVVKPSNLGDPFYVFLLVPFPTNLSEKKYREFRMSFLQDYCKVTKFVFPNAIDIVGFATEAGNSDYRSEDLIYLDASKWTDEMQEEAKTIQHELKLMTNLSVFATKEKEFPQAPSSVIQKRKRHKKKKR